MLQDIAGNPPTTRLQGTHSLKKKTLELPVRNGQWFHVDSLGVFLRLWKIKWKVLGSCNEVTANGEEVGMKAQGVLKPWNIETMG